MDIIIVLDEFSGHLFHDIELYIIAFEKLKNLNCECNNVYFLKPYKSYNEKIIDTKWNNILCLKLFNKNYIIIEKNNILDKSIIIDRNFVDTRNINKAFSASIYNFPTNLWSECFNINKSNDKKYKILYPIRNTKLRSLDEYSHKKLCSIIKKYDEDATICDVGTLSFTEQIEIFRNHNIIIGIHGNNLSGIMWAKPQSFIFEILPIKLKDSIYDYHCMSLCMKHNYTQIDCLGETINSTFTLNENSLYAIDSNLKLFCNIIN